MSARQLIGLQLRVLGALILRETRATFGTSQIGYLWAIVTPAASAAVLAALFTIVGRQAPYGASLALFFAIGVLTLDLFNKLSSGLMNVLDANKALLTYPPIKETDTIVARAVLIGATYALIMAVIFSGLIALRLADVPRHPETLLAAFGATFLLGLGFGTVNAILVAFWESWRFIEGVLTRPLFFLSGVFYVPSALPRHAVDWLEWNPVLHAVEWMRNGYYDTYDSKVLDRAYLLWVALVLVLVGFAAERATRARRSRA